MWIVVNGQNLELPEKADVPALLERLGLAKAACAVEINKKLVPKREHAAAILKDGDSIEVVALVGGG